MSRWSALVRADRAWFAANYATRVAKAYRNPPEVIAEVEAREGAALTAWLDAAARYRLPAFALAA